MRISLSKLDFLRKKATSIVKWPLIRVKFYMAFSPCGALALGGLVP